MSHWECTVPTPGSATTTSWRRTLLGLCEGNRILLLPIGVHPSRRSATPGRTISYLVLPCICPVYLASASSRQKTTTCIPCRGTLLGCSQGSWIPTIMVSSSRTASFGPALQLQIAGVEATSQIKGQSYDHAQHDHGRSHQSV